MPTAVHHPLDKRPQIFRQLLERFGIVADDGPRLFAALDGDVGWLAILLIDADRDAVGHFGHALPTADNHAGAEVAELHWKLIAKLLHQLIRNAEFTAATIHAPKPPVIGCGIGAFAGRSSGVR